MITVNAIKTQRIYFFVSLSSKETLINSFIFACPNYELQQRDWFEVVRVEVAGGGGAGGEAWLGGGLPAGWEWPVAANLHHHRLGVTLANFPTKSLRQGVIGGS